MRVALAVNYDLVLAVKNFVGSATIYVLEIEIPIGAD